MSAWAWLLGAAIQRVSSVSLRACVWTFRVAGVGNRGSVWRRWLEGWRFAWQAWGMVDDACQEDGGSACRVAGVGLRMHLGVWEAAGRWIRVAGVVTRAF